MLFCCNFYMPCSESYVLRWCLSPWWHEMLILFTLQAIMNNLPASEMIESCSIAGPGFVNIVLSRKWIARVTLYNDLFSFCWLFLYCVRKFFTQLVQSIQRMLVDGIGTWSPKLPVQRAVVDFSSPNIAKEMHVGHLRSTIIGDTLARMLEYSNVEVLRRNHVGDWGTQVFVIANCRWLCFHFENHLISYYGYLPIRW